MQVFRGDLRAGGGSRKQVLLAAADEIFAAFARQVLPVDIAAAGHYAGIAQQP